MAGLTILSAGSCLGDAVVDNETLSQYVDTSDEWIQSRTGICSRTIAVKQTTADLAYEAALKALHKMPREFDWQNISLLIVATVTPDGQTPSTACEVQKRLGLNQETVAFDVNGACSGFLMALQIAMEMLKENQKALVIGAERISSILDWKERSTCVLFGDGAGAVLIQKEEKGDYVSYCKTIPDEKELLKAMDGKKLSMKGSGVFRFALQAFETIYEKCVSKDAALDVVICHQANIRIIEKACKKQNLNFDRFFINLDHTGILLQPAFPLPWMKPWTAAF